MGNLFQELKRRKVFRVAAVYAVVAWLLIEVTSTILPTFDAPAWVNQTVTLLLILGFPIALVLSWAYEVTPEGVKSDAGTQPATVPTQSTDRNLNYLILALIVLVVGFQFSDRFFSDDASSAIRSAGSGSVSANPTVVRSSILLNQTLAPAPVMGTRTVLALAPDDSMLGYTDFSTGSLLLRDLATQETQEFVLGVSTPLFSPNSQMILVFTFPSNWSILPAQGGGLLPLPIEADVRASWLSDEEIIYQHIDGSLRIFSLADETDELIPNIDASDAGGWLFLLPQKAAYMFQKSTTLRQQNQLEIQIYDLESQSTMLVTSNGYHPQYVQSGHVLFIRRGDLWAIPFDLDALKVTGPEARILEGVDSQPALAFAAYSVSDSGRLVYLPGPEIVPNQTSVLSLDRSGRQEDIPLPAGRYADPSISPDGEYLALASFQANGSSDIWVYDFSSRTFGPRSFFGNAFNPVWTADGSRLFFQVTTMVDAAGNSRGEIWVMNVDGTGQPERILAAAVRISSFSESDEKLIYTSYSGDGPERQLNTLTFSDGAWFSAPLFHTDFGTAGGTVSPDGRWIAYVSRESGIVQIYVQPYPNLDAGKWQISIEELGSGLPSWGPNGDELFFVRADGVLMHTETTIDGDSFLHGIVEPLFPDLQADVVMNGSNYSNSNDGERIVIIQSKATLDEPDARLSQNYTELIMVENFFEELRRLAPPDAQ